MLTTWSCAKTCSTATSLRPPTEQAGVRQCQAPVCVYFHHKQTNNEATPAGSASLGQQACSLVLIYTRHIEFTFLQNLKFYLRDSEGNKHTNNQPKISSAFKAEAYIQDEYIVVDGQTLGIMWYFPPFLLNERCLQKGPERCLRG